MSRALLCVLGCAALGCTGDPVLYVELYTDFRADTEIDTVRIEISDDRSAEPFEVFRSLPNRDLLEGYRVAEVDGVRTGEVRLTAELYRRGRFVAGTSLLVSFYGTHTSSVLITRACLGRVCPDAGDPPDATRCVGAGRCVVPDCATDVPPTCPPPACASDADCPGEGVCGVGRCVTGECAVKLDDALCGGDRCEAGGVCVEVALDGGMRDGGGCGVEVCNGVDDDCDAQIDEVSGDDPLNCAACGDVCPTAPGSTPICVAGACSFTCSEGFMDCTTAPGCETASNDSQNCGACGNACSGALPFCVFDGTRYLCDDSCPAGQQLCGATCADLSSDESHCGSCGTACTLANASSTCVSGACRIAACNPGFDDCSGGDANGCETSLRTLANCGACGTPCAIPNASATCATGTCRVASCNAGFGDCDADAIDCEPLTTLMSCGACGTPCAIPNASESCATGSCRVSSCNAGFGDCDGDMIDCEPLGTLTNCGACGDVCDPNESCTTGQCSCRGSVCTATQTCCVGGGGNPQCMNLDVEETDCGACEASCGANELCNGGRCACGTNLGAVGGGAVCTGGQVCCAGACVNIGTSEAHCGGCGNACPANETCMGGTCHCGGGGTCSGAQWCAPLCNACRPTFEAVCALTSPDEDCDGDEDCADSDCVGSICATDRECRSGSCVCICPGCVPEPCP